jgi:hypothetical protein
LVFKPSGSDIPNDYNDPSGAPQKLYIQDALKKLSVDATWSDKALQKLRGDAKNQSAMLGILTKLVEDHWPLITSNIKKIFG